MRTMRVAAKTESTPSACKSHLPRPVSSTKKMKARPAPDFSKLHRKWEEQLQRGKSYKKKPNTIAQPFDVTKPGTKFTVQEKTTILNSLEEFDVDFESDQKALDTILKNKGLSEKKVTGRTTIDTLSMSTGKMKTRSCTNLGKRRILGELPCDPDQIPGDRTITAKKALAFDKDTTEDQDLEFEKDPEALISILNDEGIAPVTKETRQTFAGSACRPSLLHHPLPARQSCISSFTKKPLSKTDTENLLKSIKDQQQRTMHDNNASKSPFRSAPIAVHDSPFGQRIVRSVRNSIYGDYQVCPMSNPAVFGPKSLAMRDRQQNPFSSPSLRGAGSQNSKEQACCHGSPALTSENLNDVEKNANEQHKSVKWADVLNSYSYYSPCAVPKIKEKRTLFTTIDEIENDTDDFKENIEPAQPDENQEIDKREINNSNDVTSLADGQSLSDSSCVSLQNSAVVGSMTHTKLLEPRKQQLFQQNASETVPCKVPSHFSTHCRVDSPAPGRSLKSARRVPIVNARYDSNSHSCVSITKLDENRKVGENSQSLFHRSGISTLPKQGSTYNGKGVNLPQSHSNSNLDDIEVLRRCDNVIDNACDVNSKYQVKKSDKKDMAMHTEDKDDSEDSENVQSGSTQNTENRPPSRPDNESVDRFVGRVKSRKRQSIVELNESIVESQAHIDHLQEENEKLQDVKEAQEAEGTRINLNILQQIDIIAKQQEMLTKLQEQLKQQLFQQQTTTPVVTVTTPVSHDSRILLSASENNNNGLNQILQHQQTSSRDDLTSNVQSENILNNNLTAGSSVDDNQIVSHSVSIFASSTAALSQTLSPSRSWSCRNLTLTPSKHQSRVALATECEITPFVTKTLPQTSGNISAAAMKGIQEQIKNPTPMKLESSCGTNLFSSAPPLWTPLALKEVSLDQQGVTQDICDNEIKTCTSQVAAIDLSVKRPTDDDLLDEVEIIATCNNSVSPASVSYQSAFKRVTSPSRHSSDSNIGSLSLIGNMAPSPVDYSSKRKRLSLRRTVIAVPDEKYQEALLDEECALYSCRLQSIETPGCTGHDCTNPVARMLVDGDNMHFIPIREESPVRYYAREGSAFSCFSPSHT